MILALSPFRGKSLGFSATLKSAWPSSRHHRAAAQSRCGPEGPGCARQDGRSVCTERLDTHIAVGASTNRRTISERIHTDRIAVGTEVVLVGRQPTPGRVRREVVSDRFHIYEYGDNVRPTRPSGLVQTGALVLKTLAGVSHWTGNFGFGSDSSVGNIEEEHKKDGQTV
jgi:hypothetical protein